MPRPIFSAPILAASLSAKSAATGCATWKRLAAVQASPMLRILAIIAPSTASSTSASSKTTNGALPPSSIETRRIWSAACAISVRPTSVEPVNDSLRVRGSRIRGSITAPDERAVTTLSTPAGSPTCSRMRASMSIDSGVSLAGLTTIVQPAAIAGPILRVPIASGKFHGVISTQGPTGCLNVSSRPPPASWRVKRPSMRTASSAYQRRKLAPYVISALDSASGLPISSVISSASSSARSTIVS